MPCFLPAVEMNPRTLWACQPSAFIISASVAPLARPIISRIFAPLLSARGAAAFARAGLPAFSFLPPLVGLPGAVAFVALLAVLWALDAPFFWLTPFFEGAFSGATLAPCSATAAALSFASAFVMCCGYPFLRVVRAC